MTFLKSLPGCMLAGFVLAACGGSSEPNTPAPVPEENTVENPVVETASETDSTPEVVAEPAANPFEALPAPYNTADEARGRRTFKLCQSCHTLAEGAPNLVGPNLYGVFGRDVGGVEGFAYSQAVQDADFVWTPEILDEWLTNPRDFLPGNRMSFAGVRREEDRLGVIAYIMAETGYTTE